MQPDWLIIDGNNFIHAARGEFGLRAGKDFDAARWTLARMLDELAGELAGRVTVVFDGATGGSPKKYQITTVDVQFAPSALTADGVIERMVHGAPHPDRVLVVTSDTSERHTVEAAGGITVSCGQFRQILVERRRDLEGRIARGNQGGRATTLGEFFPKTQ